MKSEVYQRTLGCNVGPSARKLGLRQKSWVVHQDSDPKHTSKITQKLFKTKCWTVLKWPAINPDLNPIEHLWKDLKTAVGWKNLSNLKGLEQLAKEEWSQIPVEWCKKLTDGYRTRFICYFFSKCVLSNIKLRVSIILSSPFVELCLECLRFVPPRFFLCCSNVNKRNMRIPKHL